MFWHAQDSTVFGGFFPTPAKLAKNREARPHYCEPLRWNFGTFQLDAFSLPAAAA
jgi:hypothetical protein